MGNSVAKHYLLLSARGELLYPGWGEHANRETVEEISQAESRSLPHLFVVYKKNRKTGKVSYKIINKNFGYMRDTSEDLLRKKLDKFKTHF